MLDAERIKDYLKEAKKFELDASVTLEYLSQINAELRPIIEAKQELEAYLKNLVLEGGQNVKTEHGKAEIVSPFIRTSWDNKRLEKLAESMPNLSMLKKETQVGQNVRLAYNKPVDN